MYVLVSSTQQQILSACSIFFNWFCLITQTSSGSLNKMDKRNLFYTVIYRVQIMFQLGCEQGKTPTESYVQDMTKILPNMQCLLLGLTDLTLNQWGPKVNIAYYAGSILFKLTGEVCVNRRNWLEKIKQVDKICCCVLFTSTY